MIHSQKYLSISTTGFALGIVDVTSSGSQDYSLRPSIMVNYGVLTELDAIRLSTLLRGTTWRYNV